MDALWRTKIPLAPISEQHRIVAKIESLFAKLDDGVAALKRAEANLERYRASVLKAAVEGRLTERWRREHPPEETGEELLRRILAERRKRWEEEQLAKFEAKGKKPPKNWKAKYKEPVTRSAGPHSRSAMRLGLTVPSVALTNSGDSASSRRSSRAKPGIERVPDLLAHEGLALGWKS